MTFLVTVQCVKSCGHWYSRVRRMVLMLTMASIFCEVKADGFQLRGEDNIQASHRHGNPFWHLQQIWDDELSSVLDKRRHLLLRGQLLLAMGRPRDAMEVVARMLLIPCAYPDQEQSDAHEALALALAEQGLLKEAVHHWLQASRTRYDITRQILITRKATVYAQNRLELDWERQATQTVAEHLLNLSPKAERLSSAISACRLLLDRELYFPARQALAVQTGEMLLRIGDATGALEVFLQALDSGLDRCQVDKARLPENQNQLSLVSRPVAEKVTSQALNGINRCFAALRPQEAMCAVELERVTSAWLHSLTATYQADGRAASAFESLSADASQTAWWRQLCLWKASRAYFREGCFRDSLMLLERMAASDVPMPLLEHLHFLHGYALLGLGDAVQAASWLERASKATCKVLASVSLLHLAEALECQQEFKVAMETWDRLLSSSVIWHRREAEYAKKRLGWMKEKVRGNCNDKSIAVLPDDRSTHGDWPLAYGKDFHLLAAHNFRGDYIGGRIARPKYRFRTSSDHERGRLWVSKKDSLDCAALWNPRRHRHMSANRDDFGEQHYLGNGPDLIMDINLPPGTHILSLYFVNDPHFYELNRAYTITISEKEGKVLAIGQVRHFGAGIYKRYAIDGPKTIECRIWRNVSINVLLCGVFLDKPILSIPEKQLFDDINNAALCQRYAELSREVEKSTAEKLPQLANQCASLSQEFLLGDPTISRLWLASRLMNLLGLTGRGRDLVHKLSSKIIRKEDVYTFIMRNFPLASIEDQINLGWHRPGTHALDILWNRYFALSEKESLDISFMFSLSQSSDWRVTSKAMRQAGILVSREHMKLPESVSLATDFCHVTKMIQERNYYEALPLLEQLEVRAETIKDKVILMRVR